MKGYSSYIIPITLSLGVSAWCTQNRSQLDSRVISKTLYGFAKMGVTPTALLQVFEQVFGDHLGEFKDNVHSINRND